MYNITVRATLDVSHKAAGQRGILSASYDKTEGIYSPGQRGILRERGKESLCPGVTIYPERN